MPVDYKQCINTEQKQFKLRYKIINTIRDHIDNLRWNHMIELVRKVFLIKKNINANAIHTTLWVRNTFVSIVTFDQMMFMRAIKESYTSVGKWNLKGIAGPKMSLPTSWTTSVVSATSNLVHTTVGALPITNQLVTQVRNRAFSKGQKKCNSNYPSLSRWILHTQSERSTHIATLVLTVCVWRLFDIFQQLKSFSMVVTVSPLPWAILVSLCRRGGAELNHPHSHGLSLIIHTPTDHCWIGSWGCPSGLRKWLGHSRHI